MKEIGTSGGAAGKRANWPLNHASMKKAPMMIAVNKRLAPISKRFKIRRYLKSSFHKYLIHIVIAYACVTVCAAHAASISRGTYFFLYVSNEFATIAIDSRAAVRDHVTGIISNQDNVCKLTFLDEHTIFFASGVAGMKGIFDVATIAKDKFALQQNPVDLRKLAGDWAAEMARSIQITYPANRSAVDQAMHDSVISNGGFIGQNISGNVYGVHAAIKNISHTTDFGYKLAPIGPNKAVAIGHLDIAAEINSHHPSSRARAIIDANNGLRSKSKVEVWATRAEMTVKAVRDWAGDPYIGGDIATVILERGQKWRWFHRPDFCPEN